MTKDCYNCCYRTQAKNPNTFI